MSESNDYACGAPWDTEEVTGIQHHDNIRAELEYLTSGRTKSPQRDLDVLGRHRGLFTGAKETLDEIAAAHGVTRERVRQIRAGAEKHVAARLKKHRVASLLEGERVLANSGGFITVHKLAEGVATRCCFEGIHAETYLHWIIGLAGSPEMELVQGNHSTFVVGFLVRPNTLAEAIQKLDAQLRNDRSATYFALLETMRTVWPFVRDNVIEDHLRVILDDISFEMMPGLFSVSEWTRREWAKYVLEEAGEPLHFKEIAYRVNSRSSSTFHEIGFNTILNSDPLFVRVGAGDFALASWGAERYGRFDEVIERYLRRRALPEHENTIIDELTSVYTVADSTVRAMLSTHREKFTHFGGGYWGLTGRCYTLDQELEQRIAALLEEAASPLDLEIIEMVLAQGTPLPTPQEIVRTLFCSSRFSRVGSRQRALFALSARGAVGHPVTMQAADNDRLVNIRQIMQSFDKD